MTRIRMEKSKGNVFADLGFDAEESQNLKLRAELMSRIETAVAKTGLTQQAAARLLGITQPRLNALMKGKIGDFSLDALVVLMSRIGLQVTMKVRKAA
ncbi:MAG: XRE family transcriptional regulator [Alphaproteobacteria bacterium]|nr:XRE family transcriptional regulator [Alphaproteobacteria bacterium]MBF0356158.1 XRE family transcriptional regulator [Alphaproteobacteria bacterium]